MTWWKNGLLLAAGGVAGMAIAAWLESEGKFDDSWDRVLRRDNGDIDGLQVLVDKVRQEAEWAMEECTTDAQREKVYAEVNTSINEFRDALQKHGEKIITDLQEQAAINGGTEELEVGNSLLQYRSTLENLLKTLDSTQASLKPVSLQADS